MIGSLATVRSFTGDGVQLHGGMRSDPVFLIRARVRYPEIFRQRVRPRRNVALRVVLPGATRPAS